MKKKMMIEGMSCGHCKGHVTEALKEVCGVKAVEVDLANKYAVVELAHEVKEDELIAAVNEAGYDVLGVESL
ncbi:heavy-metal-associated domain-containing protein [Anaerosolibacter sp.]|uniref:heavy-metal-associated domain-containing protein n=1 Tax=Anaerosolibacter sp. TaxID=1872527 RepID=UPI0039EF1078